jgi:hypothetical protein
MATIPLFFIGAEGLATDLSFQNCAAAMRSRNAVYQPYIQEVFISYN